MDGCRWVCVLAARYGPSTSHHKEADESESCGRRWNGYTVAAVESSGVGRPVVGGSSSSVRLADWQMVFSLAHGEISTTNPRPAAHPSPLREGQHINRRPSRAGPALTTSSSRNTLRRPNPTAVAAAVKPCNAVVNVAHPRPPTQNAPLEAQ